MAHAIMLKAYIKFIFMAQFQYPFDHPIDKRFSYSRCNLLIPPGNAHFSQKIIYFMMSQHSFGSFNIESDISLPDKKTLPCCWSSGLPLMACQLLLLLQEDRMLSAQCMDYEIILNE